MNEAPNGALARTIASRSAKSPMPQLRDERSVYSCAATPHKRPPSCNTRGSKQPRGAAISGTGRTCATFEADLQLLQSVRKVRRERRRATREPAAVDLATLVLGEVTCAHDALARARPFRPPRASAACDRARPQERRS